GVRALLPLAIVSVAAHVSLNDAFQLALHYPVVYAQHLETARPAIMAFGGTFLLLLCLQFFMARQQIYWIRVVEALFARLAAWWLPPAVSVAGILVVTLLSDQDRRPLVIAAGLVAMATYYAMHGLTGLLERMVGRSQALRTGWLALSSFVYL